MAVVGSQIQTEMLDAAEISAEEKSAAATAAVEAEVNIMSHKTKKDIIGTEQDAIRG